MNWREIIGEKNYQRGKYWNQAWNPVTGCTPVSAGCDNCWAQAYLKRFKKPMELILHPEVQKQPRKWRKPRIVFVANMGDLFHNDVPDSFIMFFFSIMHNTPQQIYLILTKRVERLRFLSQSIAMNPPNIWLGVTVDNEETAKERIPILLDTPAAHRWVSFEPLLGNPHVPLEHLAALNWVVVGCESGSDRRPMDLQWAQWLVSDADQCSIPVFVKQLELDGKVMHDNTHPAWPSWAVRELPEVEK